MITSNEKEVLVSGASMAGLSTAWWMNRLGYKVTVVEIADQPRTAGAAVDIKGPAAEAARRMGIYEEIQSNVKKYNGHSLSNGALMRISPLAIAFRNVSPEE